jgi:DNA-binding IclR family transcriptional regulator
MEASTRVVVALGRLKDLFLEFPDSLVSLNEASCILALEPHQCHALLSALEDVRFLERTAEGKYGLRYVEVSSMTAPMAMRAPTGPSQPTAAA